MATRAYIGIVNRDGSVTAIYTHEDGYPDHHGPILLQHYSTEAKVRQLLKLGNLSSLGPKLGKKHDWQGRRDARAYTFAVEMAAPADASDYAKERLREATVPTAICARAQAEQWCLAMHRDREEKKEDTEAVTYGSRRSFERACEEDYTYLFADGTWKVRHWDGPWSCLSHDECRTAPEMARRCADGAP